MSSTDDIASGAWTRLRNLIIALDRVDRLETSSEFSGWLAQLTADEGALEATMREFVWRALRLASDAVNIRILTQLRLAGALKVSELMALLRLSRIELVERLTALSRAGLTIQSLESEQVEATPLALGLLAWFDEIIARMMTQAKQDYLINPATPIPPPPSHARRVNPKSEI
jgi:hypothetical protein